MSASCPNCGQRHRARPICMLQACLGILEDRLGDKLTAEQRNLIFEAIDLDEWWADYIGPAIDELEYLLSRKEHA